MVKGQVLGEGVKSLKQNFFKQTFGFLSAMFSLGFFKSAQALSNFPCPPGVRCPGAEDSTVNGLILVVIGWLLSIAFGLAVLFLIIGGFRYITSAGNEESAEAGKKTVINAIIGIVIIVLSYVIVNVIANTVSGLGGAGVP